jgi:hypothetical protein
MAGLHIGGLAVYTRDGWRIHVVQLSWPIHVLFLTANAQTLSDDTRYITNLRHDESCSYRAAGFSTIGRPFMIVTYGIHNEKVGEPPIE